MSSNPKRKRMSSEEPPSSTVEKEERRRMSSEPPSSTVEKEKSGGQSDCREITPEDRRRFRILSEMMTPMTEEMKAKMVEWHLRLTGKSPEKPFSELSEDDKARDRQSWLAQHQEFMRQDAELQKKAVETIEARKKAEEVIVAALTPAERAERARKAKEEAEEQKARRIAHHEENREILEKLIKEEGKFVHPGAIRFD